MTRRDRRFSRYEVLEPRTLLAAVAWDGGGDAVNWTDPLNWTGNAVPGASDDVAITLDDFALTVVIGSGVQTVASLSTTETLRVDAGELRSGTIELTGGELTVAGGAKVTTGTGGSSIALVNGGVLNIKAGGLVQANGSVFFTGSNASTLRVELASAASYGQLVVAGQLNLDDPLSTSIFDAVPLAGFNPAANTTLGIIRASSTKGGFDVFTGAQTSAGLPLGLTHDRDVVSVFDAGGFESNVYVPTQSLAGSSSWVGLGSSSIPATVIGLGPVKETKAIKAVRPTSAGAQSSLRLFPGQVNSTAPACKPNLSIEWDVYVPAPTAAQTQVYGPMFGVEAYGLSATNQQVRLAAAGIDGKTGEVLFLDSFLTTGDTSVFLNFDEWHHFEMVLNPGTQKYTVRVDNQPVAGAQAVDFQATASIFTDADLTIVEAFFEPPVESGTGYFDNYRVEWKAGTAGTTPDEVFNLKVLAAAPFTPTITPVFEYEYRQDVAFTFNADVNAFFGPEDVRIVSLASGNTLAPTAYTVTYQPAARRASIVFNAPLPDGNYRVVIASGAVRSSTGAPSAPVSYDFFVLAGDIDRNRSVDFNDLLVLSQNFGSEDKSFSKGNLDYDILGKVDFNDLLILSQRYGKSLALPLVSATGPQGETGLRKRTVFDLVR